MDLNNTEVLIDGTVYHLSSREDEAYLQKVAAYLNEKIGSIKKDRSYGHLSPDYQSLLIELNLADDYFKEQAHTAELEEERNSLEKDSYNLKHELVTLQMKVESLQNEKDALQAELDKEKAKKATARKRTTKSKAAEEPAKAASVPEVQSEPLKDDTEKPASTAEPVSAAKTEPEPAAKPEAESAARAASEPTPKAAAATASVTGNSQKYPYNQKQPQKNAPVYKGGSGGTKH